MMIQSSIVQLMAIGQMNEQSANVFRSYLTKPPHVLTYTSSSWKYIANNSSDGRKACLPRLTSEGNGDMKANRRGDGN